MTSLRSIPDELESCISGVLAGHSEHPVAAMADTLFTQVGAASPGDAKTDDVMFYVTKITFQSHVQCHVETQKDTMPSVND